MQVILLDKIGNLGGLGDTVSTVTLIISLLLVIA